MLGYILYVINLYFAGLLGKASIIGGVGLAITLMHCLGFWVMVGMNCAQETLTSQAFGAGELVRCGQLLNRGRAILLSLLLPISLVFYNSEKILLAIKVDPEVAHYASQFLMSQIIGCFFYGQFDLSKRFLIQLRVSWAPMFA